MFKKKSVLRIIFLILLLNLLCLYKITYAAPRLLKSFISSSAKAVSAKQRSNNIKPGEKIFFYYKIGPLQCKKGTGSPYLTKLIIQSNGKTLKDFGTHKANAANKNQIKRNMTISWYHSVMWNLTIPKNFRVGNYTALLIHQDLNSRKKIIIHYKYNVTGNTPLAVTPSSPKEKQKKSNQFKMLTGKGINVYGKVLEDRRTVANIPIKVYLISDLKQKRIALVAETQSDKKGRYSLKLEPNCVYVIKAGVDENEWKKRQGKHGGTIIDLNFPENAKNVNIPLENPR